MLVRSDGSAVAWGCNRLGQCNIPDLVEGVTYTQVDTGDEHTVLLASDGTVAVCGSNKNWTVQHPCIVRWCHLHPIAIGGYCTFLLKSDMCMHV